MVGKEGLHQAKNFSPLRAVSIMRPQWSFRIDHSSMASLNSVHGPPIASLRTHHLQVLSFLSRSTPLLPDHQDFTIRFCHLQITAGLPGPFKGQFWPGLAYVLKGIKRFQAKGFPSSMERMAHNYSRHPTEERKPLVYLAALT